jgi:hypothetical protein
MIDAVNEFPVGRETLSQVITEACLAAAERNYDEQAGHHTKRFNELLPLAIKADLEKSSPTSLGRDDPRRCKSYNRSRSARFGDARINGIIQ